ncbi:transposase, partial [Nostoc sp. FACHB-857]|uniref:transposase n=1 Tax=Nostoc sp. FACHB-857 TaxID=2692840 RepID=UPI001F558DA3
MDVELQILKHLARDAHPTVAIVDEYCAEYKELFKEVRNYECFKYLHLGIISTIKGTLKESDKYKTKIELASEIITELMESGFNIELVLADSLYGESSQFIRKIAEYNLCYVVSIRTNHGVWLPSGQSVRANKWCKFERTFSNKKSETRYIREIIYGKKRAITYWEITTDPETMPENSSSFVMTNLQGNLKKTLGDLYGLRTWVEYGFRQCKQELGWTDYRFT